MFPVGPTRKHRWGRRGSALRFQLRQARLRHVARHLRSVMAWTRTRRRGRDERPRCTRVIWVAEGQRWCIVLALFHTCLRPENRSGEQGVEQTWQP